MRANRCGTPQGGVISPLLANLYLDGLNKAVNTGRELQAVMVRYADDFVVLCRKGRGAEVYRRLKLWLEKRKLWSLPSGAQFMSSQVPSSLRMSEKCRRWDSNPHTLADTRF